MMGKYVATLDELLIVPGTVALTAGQAQTVELMGEAIPSAVPVRMIIDTGSRRSSLVPEVISSLRAVPRGDIRVETSLGAARTNVFWIRLEFPDTSLAPIPEIRVARLALPPSPRACQGVIGRDLLLRWESLLLEGRRRRFTIRDEAVRWWHWFA